MGRQISFFLCSTMRSAIETEAQRIGAKLVNYYPGDANAIEFSNSFGDDQQGRLWTEASDPAHYSALCRAIKKGSVYHRASALWVKKISQQTFDAYWNEKQKALAELVEKNQKYAIEVLGARIVKEGE